MFDFALVGDADRFETAVRMTVDTATLRTRLEAGRAGIVEHEAGVLVAEYPAHRKAVPNPMGFRGAL